jgi:nucleoside phosphorylase
VTGKKTVILVAWEDETKSLSDSDKQRLDDNNIEIVYTGIGKINATRETTRIILESIYRGDPAGGNLARLQIVNVGCAGSHTTPVRTLIKPTAFLQRDMDARQFGYKQDRTPEAAQQHWMLGVRLPSEGIQSSSPQVLRTTSHPKVLLRDPARAAEEAAEIPVKPHWIVCATGDNANGYSETSDEVPAFDAVDMEASAIAAVCAHYEVKFTCYKWITDKAAEDSTIEELIENNKLLPWTQIIDEILLLD